MSVVAIGNILSGTSLHNVPYIYNTFALHLVQKAPLNIDPKTAR